MEGNPAEFGRQHAVCQMEEDGEECGHVIESMHTKVLAMKIDDHLQEDHATTLEEQMEEIDD